jgi:hypothetical protein
MNLGLSLNSFAQDTTNVIVSTCLSGSLKSYSFSTEIVGASLFYNQGTLDILGIMNANCGATKIAIINKKNDTIFISVLDTGLMTTCSCEFNFGISTQIKNTDTTIVINNKIFKLKGTQQNIENADAENRVVISPNPVKSFLKIRTKSGNQINKIQIIDLSGKLIKVFTSNFDELNVSELKPNQYHLFIEIEGKNPLIKKFQKI